jgi:hypothetical protein
VEGVTLEELRGRLDDGRAIDLRPDHRIRIGWLQDRLLLMPGTFAEHTVEPEADEESDQGQDDNDGQRFDSVLSNFTLNIVREAFQFKAPRQHATAIAPPLGDC